MQLFVDPMCTMMLYSSKLKPTANGHLQCRSAHGGYTEQMTDEHLNAACLDCNRSMTAPLTTSGRSFRTL